MKPTSLLQFSALNRVLSKTQLKPHPSEVHGLMTGLLCGNAVLTPTLERLIIGETISHGTREALEKLYQQTVKQLTEFSFELTLLLPKDSVLLVERAESLKLWCQGFVIGLERAKIKISGRPKSDATEAIEDLIEITKMNFDPVEDENDEAAYVQLVEYVRMAVILIYQQTKEENDDQIQAIKKRSGKKLH